MFYIHDVTTLNTVKGTRTLTADIIIMMLKLRLISDFTIGDNYYDLYKHKAY